jgi:hypothetical protein
MEFTAGILTYYNYIRTHQGIGGLSPAQMAGIEIDLTENRLDDDDWVGKYKIITNKISNIHISF